MENNWYISVEGTTYGPYTWQKLCEMTKTQQVIWSTMIYHQSLGNWVMAHTIKELELSPPNTNLQPHTSSDTGSYQHAHANQQPKKKKGCLVGCLSFVGIFTLITILLVVFLVLPIMNKEPIEVSKPVVVADEEIDTNGGTIKVKDKDSDIKGLIIDVPAGAYDDDTDFEISTKEIKEHDINKYFNPILPMIHIDNGGELSNQVMKVTIPIDYDSDEIVMACYYTEAGTLEPIQTISQTDDEMVIAVTHFSDIVVTALEKTMLTDYVGDGNHDSGYRPLVDNWSFANYGSQASDGGMCVGMSLSSIHYYRYLKEKTGLPLYQYLDNNHYNTTSDFWQDDSMGIRLTSTIQENINWKGYDAFTVDYLHETEILTDEMIFYHFAYCFMLTDNAPQGVSLFVRENKPALEEAKVTDGHAIVAYAMDETGIYVCDPNFPDKTTLKIPFDGTNLGIYNTATKVGETALNYNSFSVMGSTSLYSYDSMVALFKEATKNPYEATIGDGLFDDTSFRAHIMDDSGITVVSDVEVIEIVPEDYAKYREKFEAYASSQYGWGDDAYPADWDDQLYLLFTFVSDTPTKGFAYIFVNDSKTPTYEVSAHDGRQFIKFIPIEPGITNIGIQFVKETTDSQNRRFDEYIDYNRVTVYNGEIDLTGTWEGEFNITNYEKAMTYAEEIAYWIVKGIYEILRNMFDVNELSDAELREIALESIEKNDQLDQPFPMKVILSNKSDDTYDAEVTITSDGVDTIYDTKAKFNGESLKIEIVTDDGGVFEFEYYIYSNRIIEGEFKVDYGTIGDFISGISDLTKQ